MIPKRNLRFSKSPEAKVRCKGPLGTARAQPWLSISVRTWYECEEWKMVGALWKVMHEIPLLKKNNGSCHIILSKNCEIDDSLTGVPKGRKNWNKMVRKFNATVAILLGALFHRNQFNAKAQASWAWLINFLCASWLSLLLLLYSHIIVYAPQKIAGCFPLEHIFPAA